MDTEVDIDGLADALDSRTNAVRTAAIRRAESLPRAHLARFMLRAARRYRNRTTFAACVMFGSLAAVAALTAHLAADPMRISHTILATSIALMGWLMIYLPLRGQTALADILNRVNDVDFIEPALVMLSTRGDDAGIRPAVRRTLIRLLNGVRANDASRFGREQIRALTAPLEAPSLDFALTLAALRALGQVGDEQSVPAVRRLALRVAWNPQLRFAAQDCMALLEVRVRDQQMVRTLLRASCANAEAPETLLRASVTGGLSAPVEELLRPGGSA